MEQETSNKDNKEMLILEAAVRVFSAKGFSGATTREIAQAAGVAEGTIFRYFPTKKDILRRILVKVVDTIMPKLAIDSLEKLFAACRDKTPEETLRLVLMNRVELFKENYPLLKIVLTEAQFHPELRGAVVEKILKPGKGLLEKFIADGIAAGVLREIDPRVAACSLMGMMAALVIQQQLRREEGAELDFAQEIEGIIDLFLHGIRRVDE